MTPHFRDNGGTNWAPVCRSPCHFGLLSVSDVELDDTPARKDKHYRKYAAAVERALGLFETTLQEWADYISFLNRLLKVRTGRTAPQLP